ncbi:aminoglycoside phosphotransferase family protein [Streptomyces spinosirectus]|jgi:aminoglycoside phosphotransferase (APT) family kinase protein|uniref:aminoglycoside phosphotransferase family protein n=1 Tax=Streptomyces TaxID=1883 RepID=UPI000D447DCC|nr:MULTISPECIES: aminoglycoside phosphotransferase family protein [Streptomyces]PTM85729.1 aminoglycoside phosphotransferase (APT) family kinase protein [Streptomyces sp. VMFN-G11Ma]UIR22145.1 aminoglycoside phosphotransferase family protein [Streptomyces spinosirectus]
MKIRWTFARLPGELDGVLIDETLVRRLLASQFPQWAQLPVTPVPQSGMDNATFRLGDELSVRLPRYAHWAGQVEREHRWLPRLAPQLPLPVSTPLAKGEPGEGYPYPWSVYRWLDGTTATPDALADPVRTALDLAGFITALQAADATGGPGPEQSNAFRGVPLGDARDSIAAEARVRPKIEALRGTDLVDTDVLAEVWDAALAAPAWKRAPVWIHGDLDAGNFLTRNGRLSAVIDFGTLAVADPAVDLVPAWKFLPARAREVFREAVGADDATWARGRGWALAGSLPVPEDPFFRDHPQRITAALHHLEQIIEDYRATGS